jgi:molybdate transport system regulatory protein
MIDVQVRTKCWLEIDRRFAIGQHGFELLRAIRRHRSLAGAARALGWSYRHAWDYLRRAEHAFDSPLVVVRAGKGRVRGMELSALGRDVVRLGRSLRIPTRDLTLHSKPEEPPHRRSR